MPSVPGLPSLGEKAYASSEVVLYFCAVFLLRNHCSTREWELVPEGKHHRPKCLNRPNKPLGNAPLGAVLNWPTGKWLEGMVHLVYCWKFLILVNHWSFQESKKQISILKKPFNFRTSIPWLHIKVSGFSAQFWDTTDIKICMCISEHLTFPLKNSVLSYIFL